MPETDIQLRSEIAPSKEVFAGPSPEFGRRALAAASIRDALNIDTPFQVQSKDALGNFEDRDYTLYNSASTDERREFWNQTGIIEFDEQKNKWSESTLQHMQNAKNILTGTDKYARWNKTFQQFGISLDTITADQLNGFYDKYLSTRDAKNGGIKNFISDALKQNSGSDFKVDENLDAIEWLAAMYGDKSAQIVSLLTDAEQTLATNPDTLVTNTDTNLADDESDLLSFLKKADERKPVPQPTPAQDTPPTQTPETRQPIDITTERAKPVDDNQRALQQISDQFKQDILKGQERNQETLDKVIDEFAYSKHITREEALRIFGLGTGQIKDLIPLPQLHPARTPPQESIPENPTSTRHHTIEIKPVEGEDIIDRVNQSLSTAPGSDARIEVVPGILTDYLKTISLPKGANLDELKATIKGDTIEIVGGVKAMGGLSKFEAVLKVLPNGKVEVVTHKLNPAMRHRPFIGNVETKVAHLDREIETLFSSRLPTEWDLKGFALTDGKIGVDFQKKVAVAA